MKLKQTFECLRGRVLDPEITWISLDDIFLIVVTNPGLYTDV